MYTKEKLFEQLKKLGAPRDSVVLIHIALSLVGKVQGGATALLDALIEYFTFEGGLLCIPTHTWDNVGTDKITLDMQNPESNLGAFTELAVKDSRGVRSENPTHSMVVFGDREKAEAFIKDESKIISPTAPDSCYGKLYDMQGYVLLIGVAHDKNTYLHCVEEMLNVPNRMSEIPTLDTTVRRVNGEVYTAKLKFFQCDYTDDISVLFPRYETAFRYHNCIVDGFLGDAPTQFCDAVKMKQTMQLILERSKGSDPLESGMPIPPSLYRKSR